MTIAKVRLGDVRHNPFRKFDEFPLIEKKVEALIGSIKETGFWDNVLGRVVECGVEIAYGHHRIEAARRVYGDDHEIGITIRDLSDVGMARIMGLENSEDWMNPVQHHHLVIKNARSFFDSWFERFPTWDDFRDALLQKSVSEFGASWEDIDQVVSWFGGSSEHKQCYNQSLKYGVGSPVLSRFTGIKQGEVQKVLGVAGPTEREKKQLAKIEEERRQAEEALAQQREAEAQARREQEEANRKAKEAEDERRRQAAIARNVADEERKRAARVEAERLAKEREAAKRERDEAEKRQRAAEKAQREAEKKAAEANKIEQQKRKAEHEQRLYDQSANTVWTSHDHVSEFRRLCLIPGNRDVLAKEKQAEFAAYLKEIIPGEVTTDKIRQYFESEMRNFAAGIRKTNEAENPMLELERRLEDIKAKASSMSIALCKIIDRMDKLNVATIGGIGAYGIHEKSETMLETLVKFYAKCGLRSQYLVQQTREAQPNVKLIGEIPSEVE